MLATIAWSSAISSFMSSAPGQTIGKVLTAFAVIGIIIGIAHAVWTRHGAGSGKVLRRVFEVIVLGVIFADPTIWGAIITGIAAFVGGAVNYLGGL